MPMINEIIERFNQLNTMYIGHYPNVDEGSNDFFLLSQDYEEINSNAKKMRTKFSDDEEKLIAITNEVDDIVSSFATNDAMTEFDKIDENFADINKNIHRQSRDWASYESQCARRYAELDAAINVVKRLIEEYANKNVAELGNYQEGLFARDLSKKGMRVFDKLSQNINRDKKLAQMAEKNLKALNKKYAQIEAEKLKRIRQRELNKQDGWNSLFVDGLFAAAGLTVAACTGGAAIPLVLMGSVAFTGMDLVEDLDKARTGKKEGFNLGKYILHSFFGLNKQVTDNVYNVLDFTAGIAGSGSAFKSLAKEGYFISQGVAAKPLLSSFKALRTETVSVKNATNLVKNFKNVKYLKGTGKGILQGTKTAFVKDAKGIGENLKLGWKNRFLKEGLLVHTNKTVQGTTKKIVQTCAKESGKQAEKLLVKNYVASPIVNVLADRIGGSDKTSIQYKFTKKYLSKKVNRRVMKPINLLQNGTADSLTGGKKINKIIENSERRKAFSDGSLTNEIDNLRDMMKDIEGTFK